MRLANEAGTMTKMTKAQPASSEWFEPLLNNIDDHAWYLVQTNGGEWRDHDVFVWTGYQVAAKLRPGYVRGRPTRVAKIEL